MYGAQAKALSTARSEGKRLVDKLEGEHARVLDKQEEDFKEGRLREQMIKHELSASQARHLEAQTTLQELQTNMMNMRSKHEQLLKDMDAREKVISELRITSGKLADHMAAVEMEKESSSQDIAMLQKKLQLEKQRSKDVMEAAGENRKARDAMKGELEKALKDNKMLHKQLMNMKVVPESKQHEPQPAQLVLELSGAEGLAAYLSDHPDSARRIQGEMKQQSLLGGQGGTNAPVATGEPLESKQQVQALKVRVQDLESKLEDNNNTLLETQTKLLSTKAELGEAENEKAKLVKQLAAAAAAT